MTHTAPPGGATGRELLKSWAVLAGLQALLFFIVFKPFLTGEQYFAYLDIGSDSYAQFVAHAMMMARQLATEGWTGWSFGIGWGAPTAIVMADPMSLLSQLGGPEQVQRLRIWVYLLKLAAGGGFFLLLVRPWVRRREAAILAALAYTFCGYAVTNGQWDPEATTFAFFPLVLAALAHHLRTGGLLALPLAVAASLFAGVFFVLLGVSLCVAGAGFVAMSAQPRRTARQLLVRAAPLVALGYLLALPHLLPVALQMLDSPRVAGGQSMRSAVWSEALSVSSIPMLIVQASSLLHKNLWGVGNSHASYMNYLESPDFYAGVLALLVIPQLWKGSSLERKALLLAAAAIAAYWLFPFFRLAALGFAVPYFRASTLWVTLALLLLAARAFDRVLGEGVNLPLLGVGTGFVALLLGATFALAGGALNAAHARAIGALALAGAVVLALSRTRIASGERLGLWLLALVAIDAVVVSWPSYFAGRAIASPAVQPFADKTAAALAAIRQRDPGVYRIEKTYTTVGMADAMAQGYMGVASYYYHGTAVVGFHRATGLVFDFGQQPPPNQTNWLPGPGHRFLLHSLLGVKYLIADKPIDWNGFHEVAPGPGYTVYRNDNALPLGFVQTRQVTRAQLADLAALPAGKAQGLRDAALINAVVLDAPLPAWGTPFDLDALARIENAELETFYAAPARKLQRTGLQIDHFSSNRITGTVNPEEKGILVFSIPAYDGWSLRVDGEPAPLLRVNDGMWGAPVTAGPHRIELSYRLPGRRAGTLLGAMGVLILALAVLRRRKHEAKAA